MIGQTMEERDMRRMSAELKAHRMKWNQRIGIGADHSADPDTILPAIMESELDSLQDHADTLFMIATEDTGKCDNRLLFLSELVTLQVAELRRLQAVLQDRLTEIKTQGGVH